MRLKFSPFSTGVRLDDLRPIQSDTLERIDGNEDDTAVGVNAVLGIAIADCVKN